MPGPIHQSPATRIAVAMVMSGLLAGCDSPPPGNKTAAAPPPAAEPAAATPAADPGPTSKPDLAAALTRLATSELAAGTPAKALATLTSALAADPTSGDALALSSDLLARTRWHLPEFTLSHPGPIDQITAAPGVLWTSVSGESHSTLRWDLETLRTEAVLFPVPDTNTRSLVVSPCGRFLVIQRSGITLLCDARTLKPIRDLGPLPESPTPSAVIAFSPDGLLLAHPAPASSTPDALIWQLRDTASGETLRSTLASNQKPVAAFLDRTRLQVLHQDGSLLEMPVTPTEAVETIAATESIRLLHGQYAVNGQAVLALEDISPHQAPILVTIPLGDALDTSLNDSALRERFAWSPGPCVWNGLLRETPDPPLLVVGKSATIPHHAPIQLATRITALAVAGNRIFTGESNGTLTCHRLLPLPLPGNGTPPPASPGPAQLASLQHLCTALTGIHPDTSRPAPLAERLAAARSLDPVALSQTFPALDLAPLVSALQSFQPRTAPPDAPAVYQQRLARDPEAARQIESVFEQGDPEATLAAIRAAGPRGPAAAKALELALASTRPEFLNACLETAVDLPPLLAKLALSRIAWIQNRKADALSGWSRTFPDIQQIRLREDWNGWEEADYSRALETLRLCVDEELAAIEVPENPTPEQRRAIAARLNDSATMTTVGRKRFASACLKAALAFAAYPEETETTFQLAELARNLGENPAPCLRAEAMALTALGEYKKAYDRWIMLVTSFPVEDQQPGDYAEASYTAFENANPGQAMQILTTGLHRFPNDANFALRAGWVALLTGNSERAYRFLLTGRQIGYPQDKLENAIALLAIAAQQTGAFEDATAFYQDLTRLDPAWLDRQTIETLEWPEELKAYLRQLTP